MLDICLLGTGGMMPLPYRWLTSLMVRCNGRSILIDCGEGTQVAMKKKGWSPNPIDVMLFTHYHADHISGLPGMLLSMGNAERTEPVLLAGPKGLEKVVSALRVIAPELPFSLEFLELSGEEDSFLMPGNKDLRITARRVNHRVTCYCYTLELERAGRFDADRAKAQGIPLRYWNPLQKGETITAPEGTFTPDMVMGPARKGLKVCYCTDTRPCDSIVEAARDADLFICEGMYGEDDKLGKAKEKKHMIFSEAARLAAKAGPAQLWLTHYSPSMGKPDEFIPAAREIFPETYPGRDGKSVTLKFTEEQEEE